MIASCWETSTSANIHTEMIGLLHYNACLKISDQTEFHVAGELIFYIL